MEEIEFDVSSLEETVEFSKSLGLEKVHHSQKNRFKRVLDDIEFVIDKLPEIPPMLEIEAPTREKLEESFAKLGYNMDETTNWGAKKVRDDYQEMKD
ncbi:hypothetical protein GLU60_02500 [Nanohaloarchaea archaeon H01]|nr:hypothetical protein [Nanohaloarchaea archaeon H01]